MSLTGQPKPSQELVPAGVIHTELTPIKAAVTSLVMEGLQSGAIKSEIVEFAQGLVGSDREAALIVPTYDLIATFAIISAARNPDTRADTIYYTTLRSDSGRSAGARGETTHYDRYDAILEATWPIKHDPRLETHYTTGGSHSSNLRYTLDLLASPSKDELEAIIEWRSRQKIVLDELEDNGPMGKATALVESAFGGIDIANPGSAIGELSNRVILAAILERQFKQGDSGYSTQIGSNFRIFEPRLQQLFWNKSRGHNEVFKEYLEKASALAKLAGEGESFDPARIPDLSRMFTRDTEVFLSKVWSDLERLCMVERLGRRAVEEVIRAVW